VLICAANNLAVQTASTPVLKPGVETLVLKPGVETLVLKSDG